MEEPRTLLGVLAARQPVQAQDADEDDGLNTLSRGESVRLDTETKERGEDSEAGQAIGMKSLHADGWWTTGSGAASTVLGVAWARAGRVGASRDPQDSGEIVTEARGESARMRARATEDVETRVRSEASGAARLLGLAEC